MSPGPSRLVADLLARRAGSAPEAPALVHRGRTWTFRELDGDCTALARGLAASGLKKGARAALMVPPSYEFYALTFALLRLGAVPVLVDPGIGLKSLGDCLGQAAPEAFIGSPKAHLGRVLGGWARKSARLLVAAGGWFPGTLSLARVRAAAGSGGLPAPPRGEDVAAVLFTSGSTGPSKGVVYTQDILAAQVRLLAELFRTEPGEVSVPTFPLFGLFDCALGLTVVIPEMDATRPGSVDPRAIVGPVNAHQAAQLFGSPALLDRVGRWAEREGVELPALKRVISAGAPVPTQVLARFAALLRQGTEVFTPYGATEALPVSLIGSREILGETASLSAQGRGTCVGRPVPGVTVKVIRITDEPIPLWSEDLELPRGEVGELVVAGPVVTPRYDGLAEATALAKIRTASGEVLHRMGDLGRWDEKGRLWFCGRKSQRVVTPLGTLFTVCCEAVFNAHPKVRRSALVGVGPAGTQIPVLCVELEPPADERRVRDELLELGERNPLTRTVKTVLFHPLFPVDVRHNAKIFREKLAVWAAEEVR